MKAKSRDQQELFKAEATWFHVFKAMVESGDVAAMGPYAVTVYLVIKSYTNFQTGHSFPSIETIVEKSGVSKREVLRALAVLEQQGYLSKEKRGRANTYTLREKIQLKDEEGRPRALASWDYLPSTVQAAQAELRKFKLTGDTDGLQIINIERLTLNIQVACDRPVQLNLSDIKDPALRAAIEAAYEAQSRKNGEVQ